MIDDDDIAAVVDVLRGDWLTTGPAVERFEQTIVAYTGAKHAVAYANGTAALHGCMAAAEIGAGDRVATSPLSFAASANCALYVGARAVFIDVDPVTLNLDLERIPPCEALVAVHYSGLPVDLRKLSERPRIVVEDAAQALGAHTPDGPVGNCAHSDMTIFSFHPVKSITTGEGGVVTTNDDRLARRLRRFRSHGIEPRNDLREWEYDIEQLGFNYRLTDIQAALGATQMAKLDEYVRRREEIASSYDAAFEASPLERPPTAGDGYRHARHLYPVRIEDRDRIYRALRSSGIGVQVHHVPTYRLGIHQGSPTDFPETEQAYERLLSIPLHPALTAAEQAFVIERLGNELS